MLDILILVFVIVAIDEVERIFSDVVAAIVDSGCLCGVQRTTQKE